MKISLNTRDCSVSPELVESMHRQLMFALGRFGDRIGAVELTLQRLPSPTTTGHDYLCHLRLESSVLGNVEVEAIDPDATRAVHRAIERVERRIRLDLSLRKTGVFPGVVG